MKKSGKTKRRGLPEVKTSKRLNARKKGKGKEKKYGKTSGHVDGIG